MTNIKFSLGFLWCFVFFLRDVTSKELRTDAVFLPFFEHKNFWIYKSHASQSWSVMQLLHFFMKMRFISFLVHVL